MSGAQPITCPVCDEGDLQAYVTRLPFEYKGHQTALDSYYSTCTVCGSSLATPLQCYMNKLRVVEFKHQINRLYRGGVIWIQ